MKELSAQQVDRFHADGFLIIDDFVDGRTVAEVAARFEPLFRGQFETGLQPDEWNWRAGRDSEDLTRQICNAWKSDLTVARLVLREQIGRVCAQLAGWPGARLWQDNVIWKPPGARPLGFHQDDSYCRWVVPSHTVTCWMALDATSAAGGTIEYVRGSHLWPVSPPIGQFHAPENYRLEMTEAARAVGQEPDIVYVEVPPGGCALHDGRTWHGSDTNRGTSPRRSAIAHCLSSESRFHPSQVSYIYNRYKRYGDLALDESFFPILWTADGARSRFLDAYLQAGTQAAVPAG